MPTYRLAPTLALAASAITLASMSAAFAELAVSSNDNKFILVDGATKVAQNPAPDTLAIIDLTPSPPAIAAEIEVPNSVVGPPFNAAITPDETLALVASSMKIDPNDPTKQVPDNRISVIDLKATPPSIIATIVGGKTPSGISINRAGDMALVANRGEGTVTVLGIKGKEVTTIGTVQIADDKAEVAHVTISPDGKTALVTRYGDHLVSVLAIDGAKVDYTKRDFGVGIRPYGAAINADGSMAVVANVGRGVGDADTISIIDMTAKPVRVVDTLSVGQTAEGINLSPDGKLCAVVVMNGSNKPKDSPFYGDHGNLVLYRVDKTKLSKLAEAPIGHWSQGVIFTADGTRILVQNMVEKEIWVFKLDGDILTDTGQRIKVKGGPAALRIADKPR